MRSLTRAGFAIHSAAEAFLREFDGLVLRFKSPRGSAYEYQVELGGGPPELPLPKPVIELNERIGPLVPVALYAVSPYQKIHLMAPDGIIYAYIDGEFGSPEIDNVIWGPQPDALAAVDAEVNFVRWPVFYSPAEARGHDGLNSTKPT